MGLRRVALERQGRTARDTGGNHVAIGKATETNVETFKGVVQLSGFVSSQISANRAVELARGIAGVKGVTNDMRVK